MAVLLGGRAAEELVFGEISTGAADDLIRVTDIARSMVTRYGMDPTLGQAAYETERGSFLGLPSEGGGRAAFSEDTAREIDVAVRNLVDHLFEATSSSSQPTATCSSAAPGSCCRSRPSTRRGSRS